MYQCKGVSVCIECVIVHNNIYVSRLATMRAYNRVWLFWVFDKFTAVALCRFVFES